MRKLTLSLMMAGLVSPLTAHAVGLGELVIESGLNQPLNAEIGLVSTTPAEIDDLRVRLAPAEIFAQIGIDRPVLLNKLVFTPTVENGIAVIKVNSLEPVTEPFLNFVVEVDWSQGRLLREYTVLLDPPSYTPAQAPVVTTPVNTIQEAEIVTSYEEPVISASDNFESLPLAETFPIDADIATDVVSSSAQQDEITYYSLDDAPVADTYPVDGSVSYEVGTNASIESLPDAQTFPIDGEIVDSVVDSSETFTVDEVITTNASDEYFTLDDEVIVTGDDVVVDSEYASYGSEYHVEKGDTLWNIARTVNDSGQSTQQMMIALLRANPEAFVDDNINQLKSGYILRMPDQAGTSIPGRAEALAEVKEHNALWKNYRNTLASSAVQQQRSGGQGNNTSATAQSSGSQSATPQKQVEIIVPPASQGTKGTVLADAGKLSQLQNEAALAREQLNTKNRKNQELQSRINELQNIIEKKDELIQVNNDSLQALQEQLKNSNDGGTTQAIVPSATAEVQVANSRIEELERRLQQQQQILDGKDQELAMLENQLRNERNKATATQQPTTPPGSGPDTATPGVVVESPPTQEEPTTVTEADGGGFMDKVKNLKFILGGGLGLLGIGAVLLARKKKKIKQAVDELHQFDDAEFPDEVDNLQADFSSEGMINDGTEEISAEFSQEVPDIEVTEEDILSDADQLLNNLEDTSPLVADLDFDSDVTPEDTNVIHAEFGDDEVSEGDVTGEFPVLDAGDAGLEEDEVLAEVDIYLAYGLHDQVIEELKPRLEEDPGREDYQIRLFKAYYEKKDKATFEQEATVLKSTINTSSQLWKDISVLGYSLDSDNPLYAGGDGSAISAADLIPDKPSNLDVDINSSSAQAENASDGFHETEVIEPYAVSPEEFDLLDDTDSSIEDELVETVILEETGLHELRASETAALAEEALDGAEDSADAVTKEFSGDLNLDPDTGATATEDAADERKLSEETTEFEFDLASMKGLDETSSGLESDATAFLSDIDLDTPEDDKDISELNFDDLAAADSPDLSQTIRISDKDKEELNLSDALEDLEGDLPLVTGDDEMNTKLDLAKAYVDMGDDEGARDALNEVIATGNEQQRVEAERLLNQLS